MNLYRRFQCAFNFKIMRVNLLVIWEIGIGKVEFDYSCRDLRQYACKDENMK